MYFLTGFIFGIVTALILLYTKSKIKGVKDETN